MSMTITQQDFDTGRRALERFRKLISIKYRPLLRAVTKNEKLAVEPHSSSAFTDNKTVWLPIPLALGDETLEHDKSNCGARDSVTLEMLCPMCAVEDYVDGVVFHESAHITEQSFNKVNRQVIEKLISGVFQPYLDSLSADRRKTIIRKLEVAASTMEVAGALDTWLPFATNVVEDIYVNRRLFKYREGTELPLRLFSKRTFENGMEDAKTGQLHFWRDNDPSAQAIISAYLVGQDLTEFAVHLDPACDLTKDTTVLQIVGMIPAECEVSERLEIAVELLVHLRSLGFCPPPSDSVITPPPPPQPSNPNPQQEPPPPGGQAEPSPGQGESGQEDGESEPGESQDGEGDEESGDDSGDDGKTGNAGQAGDDDEESTDAEGQGEGSDADDEADDEATGQGGSHDSDEDGEASDGDDEGSQDDGDGDGGQETTKQSTGGEESNESEPWTPPTDAEIEEAAERAKKLLTYIMGHEDTGPTGQGNGADEMVLERVLKSEGFDHYSENVTGMEVRTRDQQPYKGMLDHVKRIEVPRHMLTPSLSRLRVVFASNRKTGIERSLKAGSRLDTMHLYRAGTGDPRIFGKRNIPKARDWFVLVALDFSSSTTSNGADYAEKMAGHAIGELLYELGIRFSMYAHTSCGDVSGMARMIEHVVIKAPDENWRTKGVQETLFAQRGRATNLDGHSLEQYRKLILQERATDKMLMYFTDGEMPCANFYEELELLKENIEILRRNRVNLIGVGYRTDSPKDHGLDTIQYDEPSDVAAIVKGLEDRLLKR